MIASVSGTVLGVGLDTVVVEVGGVGLLLHTTPATAAEQRSGAPASLATTLVVREDSLTLYGFADEDERALFELVQTVSGVGPRLALAMLAVHSPAAVRTAIATGDVVALTKVPGIGRKGGERIVLELRDKVGALGASAVPGGAAAVPVSGPTGLGETAARSQVSQALVGLGWSAKQADDAVGVVLAGDPDAESDVPGLLRAALRVLRR